MDDDLPRRRWWQKRRSRAAAALWLAFPLCYELSSGPAAYCAARRWPPGRAVYESIYRPLFAAELRLDVWTGGGGNATGRPRGLRILYMAFWYREHFTQLGFKHRKASRAALAAEPLYLEP